MSVILDFAVVVNQGDLGSKVLPRAPSGTVWAAPGTAETALDALTRPGMTKDKLDSILSAQMPSDDKKSRADLTLNSDISKDKTRNQLIDWLSGIGLSIVTGELG